jgi:RHS repeat-associated protein
MQGLSSKANTFGKPDNKYKYNGKEEQRKEFADGSGLDWVDYGARMYDAQVGRFFTKDRFSEKYLSLSPYQYVKGNPIKYIDVNGDSIKYTFGGVDYYWMGQSEHGQGWFDKNGKSAMLGNDFMDAANLALARLYLGKEGAKTIDFIANNQLYDVQLEETNGKNASTAEGRKFTLKWNRNNKGEDVINELGVTGRPSFMGMGHELGHIESYMNGEYNDETWEGTEPTDNLINNEIYACHKENQFRAEQGLALRSHYGYDPTEKQGIPETKVIDNGGNSLYYNSIGTTNYKAIPAGTPAYKYKKR